MSDLLTTSRAVLPQLGDRVFLTDGGIETSLIYRQGCELPEFAAFVLLGTEKGRRALRDYFLPYVEIAARMHAALLAARARAEGHEAVCVSHQLPIWTLRRHLEGKRLWHDPRRRQCALASLTSFHFDGTTLVDITYSSPAEHLIASSASATTAKGA